MTSHTKGKAGSKFEDFPLEPFDADTARSIDEHLKRAIQAEDNEEASFHVRHARQLLEVCKDE